MYYVKKLKWGDEKPTRDEIELSSLAVRHDGTRLRHSEYPSKNGTFSDFRYRDDEPVSEPPPSATPFWECLKQLLTAKQFHALERWFRDGLSQDKIADEMGLACRSSPCKHARGAIEILKDRLANDPNFREYLASDNGTWLAHLVKCD